MDVSVVISSGFVGIWVVEIDAVEEDGVGGYIGVKESAIRSFLRGRGACGSGLMSVSSCLIRWEDRINR